MWQEFIQWIRWFLDVLMRWLRPSKTISFDSGKRVRIGKQVAEGGFSFVFEAFDCNNRRIKYALKRMHCPEREILEKCRTEASLHQRVSHPNLLPLLGMAQVDKDCFLLFPFLDMSLKTLVSTLHPVYNAAAVSNDAPIKEAYVLHLFRQIIAGVECLHQHSVSHRDIKLDNVMLHNGTPVLMDFGSAGPTQVAVGSRRVRAQIIEQASESTTISYRPPELFEGELQVPDHIDFTRVDVWSLGCLLFGILFGASPFECDFTHSSVRFAECSHLRILNGVKFPMPGHPMATWCSDQTKYLIQRMVVQRDQRLSLAQVQELLHEHGGSGGNDHHLDEGIAMLSRIV